MQIKCILMDATKSKYLLVNELTFDIQYCLKKVKPSHYRPGQAQWVPGG
jgi:hypothetical protein